jgi:hypothetical protein
MAHTFEIPFEGDAETIISKARTTIEKIDGSLNGDISTGDFVVPSMVGEVEGSYQVQGQNLVVTITKKPMIAPYSMIEDALRNYLA